MMTSRLALLVGLWLMAHGAQAQVSVVQSESIVNMVNSQVERNRTTQRLSGWSVELISTSERTKVTTLKGEFLNVFPFTKVDWDYEAPYYKLKAGAFLSKMEATRSLYRIKQHFPNAYLVRNNNIAPIDLL